MNEQQEFIVWLPLAGHPYEHLVSESLEGPHDGWTPDGQWIGQDRPEDDPVKPKRKYFLEHFCRGMNDRKALLRVYGIPVPPEVTEDHVREAVSFLGWPWFEWEPKHRGAAWLYRRESQE